MLAKKCLGSFRARKRSFSALSVAKQLQMVRKFYFKQMPKFSNSNALNIDSSIGSAIRNLLGLTMRKVIESGYDRTEVTVDTLNSEEKVKKSINLKGEFWVLRHRILRFFNRKS